MNWVPDVIFYMGLLDAGIIMVAGLVLSGLVLAGYNTDKFWDRVGPAIAILLATNIAAGLILVATRYLST